MLNRDILEAMRELGKRYISEREVELVLIGGAAGMLTGELSVNRVTMDCDVIDCVPVDALEEIEKIASELAESMGLASGWLSTQAMMLDILPDGWRRRRKAMGVFGQIRLYAIGRRDLLATKAYANRPQDREDILAMRPNRAELDFIRTYLQMLRVPSRKANLDQVESAIRLVEALQEAIDG